MSLLDDARRLAEPNPYCCQSADGDHYPDCPALAAPRIVAALEAAERLVAPQPEPRDEYDELMGVPADSVRSVDAVAYKALETTLRGAPLTGITD